MEQNNVQQETISGLAAVLRIVAVISVIAGAICAYNFGTEFNGFWRERNAVVTTLWVAGGIMNALLWWALSIIVEACQHYIKNNKR